MLRIVASLCLIFLCLYGEHRIVRMVPFGDNNVKIVFANDISDLTWQVKKLQENKSFIDFEANLTIPRRNFIFKDNSASQVAQNTPKIVRVVIATQPKSTYEIAKEKENLYFFIKKESEVAKKDKSTQSANQPIKNPTNSTSQETNKSNQNVQSQQTSKPINTAATSPKNIKKSNKKIVIDAGHGGKDCGTKSVEEVCEKVIVLTVAKILKADLKSH